VCVNIIKQNAVQIGTQPSVRIDTNAPPNPHILNGHPQVAARHTIEVLPDMPGKWQEDTQKLKQ